MDHKSSSKTGGFSRLGRNRLALLGLIALISGSAILLASSSAGRWLEESIGLSWLYQLRGQ